MTDMSDMSMSMPPTSTTSGMDMASSTSTSTSTPSTHTMLMDMSTMSMTFFTSPTTPLYSSSWTPTTTAQYTGTCIFLIILAATFRALIALRLNIYDVLPAACRRRKQRQIQRADDTHYLRDKLRPRPWQANEAVTVAFTDVILAGLSYLLMIAVMTMNVGYFMSILTGVFIGSMVFGRFMAGSAVH